MRSETYRDDPSRVPPPTFSVDDVLQLVDGNRLIEVVEVKTQGSVKMSLEEFITFYKTPAKDRKILYNVLSLEFSLTPLEDLVKSPALVREIDWVGNKWPDALRHRLVSFAGREKKLYHLHHTFPKVQNYCLMSVAQCYTDFHIDFSGTSVWYHVLKGRKVFWLIPPTETNFFIYKEFIKTVGSNGFFGKSVEKCHVAILEPGDTMIIPSGWIHAVYTPDDSLVFGGNFLHSKSCKMQTRVYHVENQLNITRKFRLPYNEELIWYVVADYVKKWCGREYARPLIPDVNDVEYVGEKWKAAGGPLKRIAYADYAGIAEETNEDYDDEESKEGVKVMAMHAADSGTPTKASLIGDCGLEEEAEEDVQERKPVVDEKKHIETAEEMQARLDAEVDELCRTNPLIFYKNQSHDFVENKSCPDHKLAIGIEPPIYLNTVETSKITPRLLEEFEALGSYMRKKAKMEMAQGICQPASLLNAFNTILKKRRAELEGKPFECPLLMPRRITRSAVESTTDNQQQAMDNSRRSSRFKVEDFPDELLEMEPPTAVKLPEQPRSGPLEYIPTPNLKLEEKNSKEGSQEDPEDEEEDPEEDPEDAEEQEEEEEEDREEEEAESAEEEPEEVEDEEEEYVPTAPVTRRSSSRKSTSKPEEAEQKVTPKKAAPKKEKKEEKRDEAKEKEKERKALERQKIREQKRKEKERRKKDSELEAELRAAHGGGASKSKKKKKQEAFVGGLPTSSIQSEPVVSNPYNYDPRMEMMKLGTGQLKSAYRKTRNNVELHFEKNLYKLEPKRGSTEEDPDGSEMRESSEERDEYPTYQAPDRTQKILFDFSGQDDGSKPPAKKIKTNSGQPIHVETSEPPKRKEQSARSSSMYTPTPISTVSPSPSDHKPKLSSPALFSPSTASPRDRRGSDAAMRKGVYMPPMSRQDKLIAEGGGSSLPQSSSAAAAPSPSASSSRHSSISTGERRPSFIPQLSSASRNSSTDNNTIYSPSAPTSARSSWLPNTSSIGSRHSTVDDDSLIDVVNDVMSPVETHHSPPFPSSSSSATAVITPPPVNFTDFSSSNGRKSHIKRQSEEGKKPKTPAKEAMAELKQLVSRLNQLNDS